MAAGDEIMAGARPVGQNVPAVCSLPSVVLLGRRRRVRR